MQAKHKDEALTNESNVHQHSKRLIITLQLGGRGRGEVAQEKRNWEEEGEGGREWRGRGEGEWEGKNKGRGHY